MYSSPLTGLNIQYDRRTCEDDGNWVSTLDNSVRCSTLSPTDEKCHHYDVNGNSGYDSCPKACGNCFEDTPNASEDSGDSMESQPMGLYSGETGETNEFDPLGSSSRGRGDLEDLVYKFTYEINDKINDLSEKIDDYKDKTDSRIDINEESNRGVCYKRVCRNIDPNKQGDPPRPSNCSGTEACSEFRYSECEEQANSCCILSRESPDYYMPSEEEKTERGCNRKEEGYDYKDISRDVADDDIQLFQQRLISGASLSGDPNQVGDPNQPGDPQDNDFNISITREGGGNINTGKDVKKGNITYIPLISSGNAENKIKDFRIDGTQDFLFEKYIHFQWFNKLETDSVLHGDNEIWTQYNFDNTTTTATPDKTYDYLVIKLTSAYVQNKDMCSNDDSEHNINNCDIFSDKDASYYIYLFANSNQDRALTKEILYGTFYYAVKESTDPKNINFTEIEMNPPDEKKLRKTNDNFLKENIVGLYFQYNANELIHQKNDGVADSYIKSRSLHIDIEYPLEDGDSDLEKFSLTIPDIFSKNTLTSPIPLLYKIHDFDKDDENINLSKIDIKIDTTHFFVKDPNPNCDSNTITTTWWISMVFIGLVNVTVYGSYATLEDYKYTDNIVIAVLSLITFSLIVVIPLVGVGKKTRAYIKLSIYLIVYLMSFLVYKGSETTKPLTYSIMGIEILQLLSVVYLINITSFTDYYNKFIDPEEKDCNLYTWLGYAVFPIFYSIIIIAIFLIQGFDMKINNIKWSNRKLLLIFAIIVHFCIPDDNKDDNDKMVKNIYQWFGYHNNSSGLGSLLRLIRDILILI